MTVQEFLAKHKVPHHTAATIRSQSGDKARIVAVSDDELELTAEMIESTNPDFPPGSTFQIKTKFFLPHFISEAGRG